MNRKEERIRKELLECVIIWYSGKAHVGDRLISGTVFASVFTHLSRTNEGCFKQQMRRFMLHTQHTNTSDLAADAQEKQQCSVTV